MIKEITYWQKKYHLTKNTRFKTGRKQSCIVWEKPNQDSPVYLVKREVGIGKIRTLHRNLLLPIGSNGPNSNKENTNIRKPRPAPRKITKSRASLEVDYDQMSEDEVSYVVPTT